MDAFEVAKYFITSFLMCILIMEIISPYIFSFYKGYQSLNDVRKIEWNSRVLSSIHAIITTILATITIFTWDFPNYAVGGHQFSFNTVAITAGYMAADLIKLLIYK